MANLNLVVLQPTPFCNISCKYCYLPHRSSKQRMSLETIAKTFSRIFATGWVDQRLDIAWHAGEPLALPVAYYSDAFQLINSLLPGGIELQHNFQTNGTLIDADWCRFLKLSRSRVGVSIDGPQALNDENRVRRGGGGTFSDILAGIRQLQEHEVDYHVITVLTYQSLGHARELYEFYQAEGIERVCFNIEEIEGVNRLSSLSSPDVEERFDRFIREFWNLNVQIQAIPYIREFDRMLKYIVRPQGQELFNAMVEPFAVLNVDCDGNFSTYSPELIGHLHAEYDDFILGNVWNTTIRDVQLRPSFQRLAEDIATGVEICRSQCEYFSVCGGGAPANKFYENGTMASGETLYCRLLVKRLADVAMEIVENSAVDMLVEANER